MISAVISRIVILLFGTLYPAYASYKAVKTKNVKEYVKWMMYWIVFAFFTCAETVTDILFSFWFPFYYEIKIILVIWLLSPVTKGSSILYRKFVHPELARREEEIDNYISRAREQGYNTVLQIGVGGFNFARELLVQAALKGHGGIVEQLKRSYSLNDLSSETDGLLRMTPPRGTTTVTGEVNSNEVETMDCDPRLAIDPKHRKALRSYEDSETDTADGPTISSGYSSAVDTGSSGEVAASSSSTGRTVRQRNTKNSTKTSSSSSRKSIQSNTEESIYATLPRTSKRITRKKVNSENV